MTFLLFENIIFFVLLYLVEKHAKKERYFVTSTPILLNPKISFLLGKGGGVCAERDVTQEGSRD